MKTKQWIQLTMSSQGFIIAVWNTMMKSNSAIIFFVLMSVMSTTWAAEDVTSSTEKSSHRNWHFNVNIAYTSRTLSGTIANQTGITDNVFGDLVATGDSMNVDSSNGVMLALGAQYKRWGMGLNYMPTSFTGQGSAIVTLGGNQAGVVVKTPLNTNIDVNMLLANGSYNFIQTKNTVFGVGIGYGRTDISLNITPDVGNPIIYDGQQPFGFLNLHMSSSYKKFHYGFALNGISATFSGVEVDYSDYKVDLGYRVIDKAFKMDLVGGYRLVNFAIDIENGPDIVKASVALQGPFLGLNFIY